MKNKTSKLIAAGVLLSVATLGTSAFAESTGVTKTQVGFSNSYIPEAPDEESVIGGSQARMVAPSDTSLATDNNAIKIMEADNRGANEARGKHALEMTDIKLEVPAGGVRNVIYDGQINWTLTNGI